MGSEWDELPAWERLLAAERHLQQLVPGTVLVGGTAAALHAQVSGASPLTEVVERLAAATPSDRDAIDLASYRGLAPPWNDWAFLAERGRAHAARLAAIVMAAP